MRQEEIPQEAVEAKRSSASGASPPGATFLFGDFQVNVDSLELLRHGHPIPLTPKGFDTLVILLRNRHRVTTKDELLRQIWNETFVSEDSLSQCISALRKALGDDSTQPQFISTVPRRGYRFIAPVTVVNPSPGEGEAPHARDTDAPKPTASRWPSPLVWAALAAVSLLAVSGWGVVAMMRRAPAPQALRLNLQAPFGTTLASGATLSPDGRLAVFIAENSQSGKGQLWVQGLDATESRVLEGTEGATLPFWSPDSRFVAYFAGGQLKKVEIGSGPPQTIAMAGLAPAGGTWNQDGTILFAGYRSAIFSVASSGGTPTPVTTLGEGGHGRAHSWPAFLPDGRHFLFTTDHVDPNLDGTYVGSLDGEPARRLIGDPHAIYAEPGYLVFVRDRVLMAHPFDAARLTAGAAPEIVIGDVSAPSVRSGATVSASASGLLSYGGNTLESRLVWLDRNGQRLTGIEAPADLHNPAFAGNDDTLLADGNGVWLVDLPRGAATRIVQDGQIPVASPDGTRLVFDALRANDTYDIFIKSVGSNTDQLLLHTPENKVVTDWTRDGRYLVFVSRNPRTGRDLWVLPMTGEAKPFPFAVSPANEIQAQVSPDGRSIAYTSDESGEWEVYIESFPQPGRKRAVSSGGGGKPQWRADGKEMFYVAPDRTILSVKMASDGELTRPVPLFKAPVIADIGLNRTQFAVSSDGQRFLVDAIDPGSGREPVTILVNWPAMLGRF